ncbi:hypothetical protein A0H76_548 [Hepatospora eriocheir]|uniref:Uncharacterized protein n=1 Tax=Hepatospora eriocheir TaxID=1081669 RepID=A0A1X0QIL1_9MICR|nr:hypothetical protein A0H76_548 [Hepatospora eriocheir]
MILYLLENSQIIMYIKKSTHKKQAVFNLEFSKFSLIKLKGHDFIKSSSFITSFIENFCIMSSTKRLLFCL